MPILMVSAKDSESDKIVGLEMGADDYITKPFQIRELMARIKANLRKTEAKMGGEKDLVEEKEEEIVEVGDLRLDLKKLEATMKGKLINLTKKEFDVLKYLALQPGQVVSREQLLHEIWEYEEYVGAIRTIDVTINRIREKIEKDKADPKVLVTKRGVGYYIADTTKKLEETKVQLLHSKDSFFHSLYKFFNFWKLQTLLRLHIRRSYLLHRLM